jgi:hypothetical protein
LQCSGTVCASCITGYSVNSAGVCVLSCQLPCISCLDNLPTACTACQSGSGLSGNTCVLDLSCNNGSSCTDCGQGLNYVLVAGQCLGCPTIANCVQCSSTNSYLCAICRSGFYLNSSGLCIACPSSCTNCLSGSVCTGCAAGFTLPGDSTRGRCRACRSPCATCASSATYCTSCLTGFSKVGWKCRNNSYVDFSVTLSTNASFIFADLDTIVSFILTILNESLTNIHKVTFHKIKDGSAVVGGSVDSTTLPTSTAAAMLATGFSSGGSVGSFPVVSSSVTVYGGSDSDNVGVIVGATIGAVAGLGIFLVM